MALSKKQFKKLKKSMMKGKSLDPERHDSPPSGKTSGGKVSGDKSYVQELNDEPHFGAEGDCEGGDYDDTFKGDNDSFINTDDEADDDDFFDGTGHPGKLSFDAALSGPLLDTVKNARTVAIDNLFTRGHINGHARRQMIERYVNGESIAFSHTHDDGFNDIVKMLEANGKVLNTGRTGPQTAGALVELSKGGIDAVDNPLIADANRRAQGKNNL